MEHRGDNSLLAGTLDFVKDLLFFASKWVPASIVEFSQSAQPDPALATRLSLNYQFSTMA
jgi:hypothetical protein